MSDAEFLFSLRTFRNFVVVVVAAALSVCMGVRACVKGDGEVCVCVCVCVGGGGALGEGDGWGAGM